MINEKNWIMSLFVIVGDNEVFPLPKSYCYLESICLGATVCGPFSTCSD